ncbi:MAG: hypothetical protein IKU70_08720 [Clostridia bacterium]|nr:hypothetical protein [Clostridia bacterium]
MNKQVSPFAALTGAEKQIRWLEYQSIKLPYVDTAAEKTVSEHVEKVRSAPEKSCAEDRPQPPPEVPRVYSSEQQRSRHSQYDAVIARLKQAELQARYYGSHIPEQIK